MKIIFLYVPFFLFCFCQTIHAKHPDYNYIKTKKENMVSSSRPTTKSNIDTAIVTAIMDFNQDDLTKVLTNYDKYDEFLPFVTSSTPLPGSTGKSRFLITADILHGAVSVSATVESKTYLETTPVHRVDISLIKGNLKRLDIFFKIIKVSEKKSIMSLTLMIDPDLWFVSDKVLSNYNKVNARRIVRSLRAFMEGK